MPIGSTNIKMSDINTEMTNVNSTSLTTLSTNAITTGNTIDGNAPHGMNEFAGYVHTNMGSWPSLSGFGGTHTHTVSSGTYQNAEAFASMSLKNDTGNSRIEATWYSGTAAAYATVYTDYINYSGFTGNVYVQYNDTAGTNPFPVDVNSGSMSYPPYGWPGHASNSTSGSYTGSSYRKVPATDYLIPTSGYVQFKWLVRTNASQYDNQEDKVWHNGVTFTTKFTDNSIVYSSTSSSSNVRITARKGMIF